MERKGCCLRKMMLPRIYRRVVIGLVGGMGFQEASFPAKISAFPLSFLHCTSHHGSL